MNVPPFATILFDLDGTLTDPKPGITGSLQYALRGLGRDVPSQTELEWVIGPPMIESLERLVGKADAVEGLRLYRERYGKTGLYENEVYAGIPELLAGLKAQGCRMFVATSKMRAYAVEIVAHFGLAPYFDGVYGSSPDGSLAHKGELLTHLLATERFGADEAVMIGDRLYDANGAAHVGMPAIGVTWGYGARQELIDAGMAALVDVPHEVPGVLARLRRNDGGTGY